MTNNVVREFTPAVTVTISGELLVIHTQPSSTATAGRAFATQPVVYLVDQNGNLETGDNSTVVTVSLASGTGSLQEPTSVTVKGGIATFTGLSEMTAGTIALQFSCGGLTGGPSYNILVSPATPFRLAIHTQPSATATVGQPFAIQPVIDELDQYGNIETGDSSTLIAASLSLGNGPLAGTTTATLVGGVATFINLADTSIGTIALGFAGGGLSVGPSSPVTVTPPNSPTPTPTLPLAPTPTPAPLVTVVSVEDVKGKKHLVDEIVVYFRGRVNAAQADNVAIYRLTTANRKGSFTARNSPVIKLRSADFNPANDTVTLTPKRAFALTKPVELTINGTAPSGLEDSSGQLIDGDDNGTAGGNAVAEILRTGVTLNPVAPAPEGKRGRS